MVVQERQGAVPVELVVAALLLLRAALVGFGASVELRTKSDEFVELVSAPVGQRVEQVGQSVEWVGRSEL